MRHKTNATNRKAEIILATIEKNSYINVEEFFRKMHGTSPLEVSRKHSVKRHVAA